MKSPLKQALILLSLLAPQLPAQGASNLQIETLADTLQHPFSMALLPSGEILVSEKPGHLRLVRGGALTADPVVGMPEVYGYGHSGLLDLALHPDFDHNRWLYFTYATGSFTASELHVARGRFNAGEGDKATVDDVEIIFSTGTLTSKPVHLGGRLAFGVDGTLLLTTGDRSIYRERAQALDNLVGKTLRLNADGSIPADNPFVGTPGAHPAIWTHGHRNAQGLYVDRATGRVYANEHGPQGGDELNLLRTGGNFGWPLASHGIDYSGAYITPFRQYPGTVPPLVDWTPSLAPSGMTQCRNCLWPEWEGDLFIGMLAGRQVRRIVLTDGQVSGQEALLGDLGERIRDLRFGADGALYLLTDGKPGKLIKVAPGN